MVADRGEGYRDESYHGRQLPALLSRLSASLRRCARSYWFERVLFALGSVFIFMTQTFISDSQGNPRDDVKYFERGVLQVQLASQDRSDRLAEYNRSVSMIPQDHDLVGFSAFRLYEQTEHVLAGLAAIVVERGEGRAQEIIDEKNARIEE